MARKGTAVRRRVELNSALSPLALRRAVLSEVCAHALETLPEECCGLVLGDDQERYRSALRCRNDSTRHHRRDPQGFPRDGQEGFYMNELDYLHAQDLAQTQGQRITAVYHSHVECGVYFSDLDQAYAGHQLFPFPQADHLVVSVIGGRVGGVGLFFRSGSQGEFAGRCVVPSRP